MGISFKESSAWVGLIVTAAIFANFFFKALAAPDMTFLFLLRATIAAVAWQTLLHIVLAVRKPPEALADEDRHIAASAACVGFGVLSAGLFVILGQALFPAWLGRLPMFRDVAPLTLIVDLAVATFALAEIARCLTQIVLYRGRATITVSE